MCKIKLQRGCTISYLFLLLVRFAEIFVESGGVQLLLSLPRNKHTFVGLSFAFFGLVSVPLAVERVVRSLHADILLSHAMPLTPCSKYLF